MAVNKVIDRNNNILVDLTYDSVKPNKVKFGETFHGADGNTYIGNMVGLDPDELDTTKYNFIDYDGTLMYSFTDEELDALTELPQPADHSDEKLVFQEWNWDLEDLKTWNRERPDRPIVGPNYITDDEKTYIVLSPQPGDLKTLFYFWGEYISGTGGYPTVSIDWGDGNIETLTVKSNSTTITHTYSENKEYVVVIEPLTGKEYLSFGASGNVSMSATHYYGNNVKSVRLGYFKNIGYTTKFLYSRLMKCNIPANIKSISYGAFKNCGINAIVFPKNLNNSNNDIGSNYSHLLTTVSFPKSIKGNINFLTCRGIKNIVLPEENLSTSATCTINYCNSLKKLYVPDIYGNSVSIRECTRLSYVRLPDTLTTLPQYFANACYSLRDLTLPNSLKTIYNYAFYTCENLERVVIPDSVTTLSGTTIFSGFYGVLDLSQQTKVINLTSAVGLTNNLNKILVPNTLLDQYKSASYWSNYASQMVGV